VVHRLTGDGPKRLLIEPQWSTDKKRVLNTLSRKIREA
jgi:radical SAM superfamily enzyme